MCGAGGSACRGTGDAAHRVVVPPDRERPRAHVGRGADECPDAGVVERPPLRRSRPSVRRPGRSCRRGSASTRGRRCAPARPRRRRPRSPASARSVSRKLSRLRSVGKFVRSQPYSYAMNGLWARAHVVHPRLHERERHMPVRIDERDAGADALDPGVAVAGEDEVVGVDAADEADDLRASTARGCRRRSGDPSRGSSGRSCTQRACTR